MKLTWHIVLKDARRLWIPFALWVVLLTLKHGVDWRLLHVVTEDAVWVQRMRAFAIMLTGLGYFIGYILAAALVKEDAPTGNNGFWMTRPVSGARLLGAKVLGCAVLLGILPVLAALPWWLAGGRTGLELLLATREALWWQAWTVAPALVVAAITESLGWFLAWTIAFQLGSLWALASWHSGSSRLMKAIAGTGDSVPGELKLAVALALVGPAAAVVVQYVTRRSRLAIAIAGATAAGAVAIAVRVLFEW